MSGTAPGSLLTRTEQLLYARLVRAFPGHVVLAKVAVSVLLASEPTPASSRTSRLGVVDCVVCRPDFTAIAVIDILDSAPLHGPQRDRHRRRDEWLRAAGVKVVRVSAIDLPPEAALRALVAALPLHAQSMRRAS